MKKLITSIAVFSLLALVTLPVIAAGSETVTATVTPEVVSISVVSGSVGYGTLGASDTNNTFDGAAIADTQTIMSGSNVSTDIVLRSSDADVSASPGVTDWDLVGTAAADDFEHSYDIDASGTAVWTNFPSNGTFDNTYTAIVVTLPSNGNTATLDLKIDMPTSITNTAVHSIAVTIMATAT